MRILIIIFFVVAPLVYSNDMEAQLVTYVSRAPLFEGDLNAFVMNRIDYPLFAKRDSIEGRVLISFMIDTMGNTFDHVVVRGIREDLDLEALRVARLIKYDAPAMQKDKPVIVKFVVPVDFSLQYDQLMKNNFICDSLNNHTDSPLLRKSSQKIVDKMCKKIQSYRNDNLSYFPIVLFINNDGIPISVQIKLESELDSHLVSDLIDESMKLKFFPRKKSGVNRNGCYTLIFRFDKENEKWFYPDILYF